ILMVVVLPAPFGPRKPKICPRVTFSEMPRTASTFFPENGLRNVFVRRSTSSTTEDDIVNHSSLVVRACGMGPLEYSWSLYWILRGDTPRMFAAFEVDPPHASSVRRIAYRSRSWMVDPGIGGGPSACFGASAGGRWRTSIC